VGFQPTIAVLERAKTVRALDRSTTAIGFFCIRVNKWPLSNPLSTLNYCRNSAATIVYCLNWLQLLHTIRRPRVMVHWLPLTVSATHLEHIGFRSVRPNILNVVFPDLPLSLQINARSESYINSLPLHFTPFRVHALHLHLDDRLWGLLVRVPDYRSWGPRFDSQRYQIFWEVMRLERDPLNLMSTTEELLGRKSSGSCLESRE
jgi:hypothetical protein